jgi:hypothetical protein
MEMVRFCMGGVEAKLHVFLCHASYDINQSPKNVVVSKCADKDSQCYGP